MKTYRVTITATPGGTTDSMFVGASMRVAVARALFLRFGNLSPKGCSVVVTRVEKETLRRPDPRAAATVAVSP